MNGPSIRVGVLGGGALGMATAHQLRGAGAEVILLTEGPLASNASGRSLSWLNSAGDRHETYHRLRMAGIDRYRTLASQHPLAAWLRFDGGLTWRSEEQAELLRSRHRAEVDHGYASIWLSPDQVAARIPGVDPSAIPPSGAVWNPGEGWVDLPSLIQHLAADFADLGGRLIPHAGPASVELDGGAVAAVTTADGHRHEVDAAVLATGSAVPAMAAQLGVIVPEATPNALLVNSEPLPHPLTAVLNTPRVSLRPSPNGALAVDADWPTASISGGPESGFRVPAGVIETLLDEASRVLAGHPRLRSSRVAIGPKPIPADGDPVLGRVDMIPGLWLAFTHSGATLALIVGELLAHEIIDDSAHPMLTAFNLRRFSAPSENGTG